MDSESLDSSQAVSSSIDIHGTPMYSSSMHMAKDLIGASAAPLILSILQDGESYGYALIQRVRELSNGQLEWTDGMLYPVLHRLEKQGMITSKWKKSETGRERKYYVLNADGRKSLAMQREQWRVIVGTLNELWGDLACST